MSEAERKAGLDRMRAYIATLQPLMRLQQWEIVVHDDPTEDEDYVASINRDSRSWRANVRFGDVHFGHSREEQRLTVVHELTHIHMMTLDRAAKDATFCLDPTSWRRLDERIDHELEMTTDAISRTIAPFLPLPPAEAIQKAA